MPNIYEPEFDVEQDNEPYVWQRALIGRAAGAERLGASLFALPPGGTTFPLHAHLHNEELLIVVAGAPTLRTLDGERTLAPGEVVAFPAGRGGRTPAAQRLRPARLAADRLDDGRARDQPLPGHRRDLGPRLHPGHRRARRSIRRQSTAAPRRLLIFPNPRGD